LAHVQKGPQRSNAVLGKKDAHAFIDRQQVIIAGRVVWGVLCPSAGGRTDIININIFLYIELKPLATECV